MQLANHYAIKTTKRYSDYVYIPVLVLQECHWVLLAEANNTTVKLGKKVQPLNSSTIQENFADLYLLRTWRLFNVAELSTNKYSNFTVLHRIKICTLQHMTVNG